MMKNDCGKFGHVLMLLSAVAAILSAVVSLAKMDAILGLAGTQWILVAILLAIYALASGAHNSECKSDKSE